MGKRKGSPANQEVYGEGQNSAVTAAPRERLWPLVLESLAWPSKSVPQKAHIYLRCFLQPKPDR